jgi:hypothetical protein
MGSERGQSSVEWTGLLLLVALSFTCLVALGARVPGAGLAWSLTSRILCAAALAERCGDEPRLIAAYGSEVGALARAHMPTIVFEPGSRAVPVDFRRCRASPCGDALDHGVVRRTELALRVTAFVHVVDCRAGETEVTEAAGADCSGPRAGNLYLQYWTYYADSASLRGIPIAGGAGFHRDDWEGVQVRIGPDGQVDQRASSHAGYNYSREDLNWASDAGIGPLRQLAEALDTRAANGWGPETHLLLVSGGSHAGNAAGRHDFSRFTPGRQVHLIPLEPIAAEESATSFAVSPPWRKQVWRDPEAESTG